MEVSVRELWMVSVVALLSACSGAEDVRAGVEGAADADRGRGAVEESVQAPVVADEAPPDVEPAQDPTEGLDIHVRSTLVGTALAEDGQGTRAESTQAVAIDLTSRGWPGEAMEPSLRVGDRTFLHYTHPDPVSLRFVVSGPDRLPPGQTGLILFGERVVAEITLPPVQTP